MKKVLCGTEPFPTDYRAKKYKLEKHFIEKVKLSNQFHSLSSRFTGLATYKDFVQIMKNLPVEVSEEDIDEMFEFADKNQDGKLSYKEFKESL